MKDISVFWGANTTEGFYTLAEEAVASLGPKRVFVVKGSAGCGKSGLMRRVALHAESRGENAIRVLCSGDPDSLDAVCLPDRGVVIVDGTSPHVMEPKLTGEKGFYVDLSRFFLRPAERLAPLEQAYREHYRRAYCFLAAAGSTGEALFCPPEAAEAVAKRAKALAERSLRKRKGRGRVFRSFTDAITCRGLISLPETHRQLSAHLISLTGDRERADIFLRAVLDAALERGYDVLLCPDPLQPRLAAHLAVPEAGLGFTTGEGDRRIHLEKLGAPLAEAEITRRREIGRLRQELLTHARAELALAKAEHDRLETAIHPCVDFSAVTKETERLIRRVFGE